MATQWLEGTGLTSKKKLRPSLVSVDAWVCRGLNIVSFKLGSLWDLGPGISRTIPEAFIPESLVVSLPLTIRPNSEMDTSLNLPSPLVALFFVGWGHILLYGVNTVLFAVGMYLLRQRTVREGTMFLMISSSILFVLASISAVVNTTIVVGGYLSIPLPGNSTTSINLQVCSIIQYVVFHLVDLTAFIVLAYRCFNIWDRRFLVIALPVGIFVAETGVYFYELRRYMKVQQFATLHRLYNFTNQALPFTSATLILAAMANALLTLLIVGRMWWMKRRIQRFMRNGIAGNLPQKYESIIAITMESGMIIPTFFILLTIYNILDAKTGDHDDAIIIMSCMISQVIALAPLIIMVRVGLGLTVERNHVEDSTPLSTMRSSPRSSQVGTFPCGLNIHRDVRVSVSVSPPRESEDVEYNLVLEGRRFNLEV
ncbi:hypothetical protein E1B28_011725 [Marasmius oreades]|uniref:Uncharacterized protein n=1 Tax=Marasmius oreades TaxID=181124 RepID=A0A9P7RUN9_9AGAR|nr:uncharacterized protein E1B28_011725 [Marasmius oreades]KAG7090114.1 hypothetical protein E1B28_011725 [Marasmius oreades]